MSGRHGLHTSNRALGWLNCKLFVSCRRYLPHIVAHLDLLFNLFATRNINVGLICALTHLLLILKVVYIRPIGAPLHFILLHRSVLFELGHVVDSSADLGHTSTELQVFQRQGVLRTIR